ncbi:hypothetical protein D9758_005030 [Tetrapyrgos nigripes]|uniref:Uncharacterized protein n=1 Tax=Tetrapyrgos nigripes TaxID=182062 RepID=A0A8H5LWP1_9AGAR|nr:hypothetical protein D9758_005030 [Tetrapyrgos nigripes]
MESALRSETVADAGPISNITPSWSSNESLSGWIVSPTSTSGETLPRAVRSSAQNMYFHDSSSYHVPSFAIPGAGTELSGSQVLSESYSLVDARLDHSLAHYNAKHEEKHDASYLHSIPSASDEHYGETHYPYHQPARSHLPQSVLHHRQNHAQPSIYNHSNGWTHSPAASHPASTTFPYSDTREGTSPFLSSEPSPRDQTHQRMSSFPDSNHSDDLYTTMPLLSDNHQYANSFLHDHTPKQFVNMSDIASMHGAGADSFNSDYAHSQISPADAGDGGTISLVSLGDPSNCSGEYAVSDQGSGVKRKRNGSEVDDEAADGSEAGESAHSFSSSSSYKRSRLANGVSGGRQRKSTVSTQLSMTVVGSPEEAKISADEVDRDAADEQGDDYEDYVDDDDNSDAYVPSRSTSPRGRRASRSSSDSSGRRRGVRAPGSAAEALKYIESSMMGSGSSPDDSSALGDLSFDSNSSWRPSKPVSVPNVTKKSRGRKVPVHTSTSSLDQSQYGAINSYQQSGRLSLDTADMSGFYQHPNQYTHQQTASLESLSDVVETASSAPQHGRPAKGKYSTRAAGEYDTDDYGPGAKVVSGGIKKANGDRRSLHTWDKLADKFVLAI